MIQNAAQHWSSSERTFRKPITLESFYCFFENKSNEGRPNRTALSLLFIFPSSSNSSWCFCLHSAFSSSVISRRTAAWISNHQCHIT